MKEEIHESKENLLARAQSAESKLNLIYSSKLWRISSRIRKLFPSFFHLSKFERKMMGVSSDCNLVGPLIAKDVETILFDEPNKNFGLAVVAHWSHHSIFDKAFIYLVGKLIKSNLNVIIVSANLELSLDGLPDSLRNKVTVLVKPNIGYDFGSWLAAFETFPSLFESSELILLNDSCLGPFCEFDEIFDICRRSPYDITSLTDSPRLGYHLQTYFLHLKSSAINSQALLRFFKELPYIENKSELILRYEIGFTLNMQDAELLCGALYPWNSHSKPWINPTIGNAKKLIEIGFPFIKKEFFKSAVKQDQSQVKNEIALKYHDDYVLQKILEDI